MANSEGSDRLNDSEIAIIGMACRFPRAGNVDAFWQNLRDGVEAITFLNDAELEPSLVDPADPGDPNYVKAASILEGVDLFDAAFFGYTPREAEVMDPQHRLFMECAWEALEHAGYDPETYKGAIGVFAGARTNTYLFNLFSNREQLASFGAFEIGLGNDLAFLPTRVSYKFNLRGPSYAVHTACSTSLVAIHLACQSLLIDECQMVLAGGVAVNIPQKTGYLYTRGGIASPDGHCRAFDAKAQGTLFGSGVGIVMLKRLEDALADGDTIHAVIKGTAANNDGSAKASFTAPSVNGQTEVISEALANACVDPATITYVETHGTGTALGDPIEIRGLMKAFRTKGQAKNFRAIGSVKSNLGHLDAAAGIASFIKTALAIKHKMIPPSLHFEEPNANIDFDNSSFYVNTQLCEWKTEGWPRRAGVSAFGVGGTNAHAILEEAPPVEESSESKPWQLLVLSAKTSTALDRATANLAAYFKAHAHAKLADVAYTLQVGRRPFSHRRFVVGRDSGGALRELESLNPQSVFSDFQEASDRPVVFMFPGGGAQYANMGYDLYQTEQVFREQVDLCCDILKPSLGFDLRELLFPAAEQAEEVSEKLRQTSVALPALFVIEYAMAKLWISLAVRPVALIGHSLGEYVAACLSGVFSLPDALALVVLRGRLFELLPRGAMLSVSLSESEVRSMIADRLSIAAINGPSQCVLSGPANAIDEMAAALAEKEIDARRLHIDVAAHSTMVASILDSFRGFIEKLDLREPKIPFISNVTGDWITAEEATSPDYWARHLRETVRFADGLRKLMKEPSRVLLEVGPGQTLSTLAKLQPDYHAGRVVLSSMRHPFEPQSDLAFMLTVLGKLWLSGVEINWSALYAGEHRHRLPLPTYPFERQRYWIEPEGFAAKTATPRRAALGKRSDIAEWFHAPSWKQTALPRLATESSIDQSERRWLVFVNDSSLSQQLLERLRQKESHITSVMAGERFARLGERAYAINMGKREDYLELIKDVQAVDQAPTDVLHLWNLTPESRAETNVESFNQAQGAAFYSLLYLAQAVGEHHLVDPLQWWIITNGLHEIESGDRSQPEKATMLGPCKVIPQEQQNVVSHCIDVVVAAPGSRLERKLVDQLMREFLAQSSDPMLAYRGSRRWVQTFEPVQLREDDEAVRPLRQNGVYLITGGLGGVGLLLAEHLARTVQARLILAGRSTLPDKQAWDEWLAGHDDEDATSYKIRKVQSLEALGAEVMTVSADVASEDQMGALIQNIYERYGELNGVIHAAGVTSGSSVFTPISEIGPPEAEAQFQPKVIGVYVLEKRLRDKDVDFCVMTSSNSSVLGGMGFVAYSAANAFMDAFASSSSKPSRTCWVSSSWDPWPEETKKYTSVQTSMDKYAMTADESVEAFRRVMTMADEGHLVVATGDLPERIDLWIRRDSTVADTPAGGVHPRPGIQSAYVAPSGETEQAIAKSWQALLGIEQVGAHDNFFDLGGHSLLATKLVARLRAEFQVDLPLQKFFESPTIAGLARAITSLQAESEDQQTADLLERVAHLSDEEVEMELTKGLNPR